MGRGPEGGGKTDAQIAEALKSFDVWDRNDYDNDGNFNEPDGYLDHFQIVHAGGDQADGDPYQGEDAIWSHRSKAFVNSTAPPARTFNKDGGVQIGATGLWVADYTMQPENGGVSVFAHEYAHDLGLPDEYDTTAATGTQENAVNWWSIMAQSRQSGAGEPVGTRAADFGAWDKLQLGWLDYEVVPAGKTRALDLGPPEYNSAKAQGVVVPLPKKTVTTQLGAPHGGTKQWWSDQGDELRVHADPAGTLPAGSSSLSLLGALEHRGLRPRRLRLRVRRGRRRDRLQGHPGLDRERRRGQRHRRLPPGLDAGTFDLSAFAGKTVGAAPALPAPTPPQQGQDVTKPAGIFADDFTLTAGGDDGVQDGAESGNNGWTPDGFVTVGASRSIDYDNYYVASNRQYVSYDKYLKTGPYNYYSRRGPNLAEHFPYQDGLIVSYWDTSYSDNDESVHPGEGEILAVDSHPQPIFRLDGPPWRRGSRRTTRRSRSRRPTRSRSTCRTRSPATSAARTPSRCSTTASRTGTRRMPNVGVKVPERGRPDPVQKQDGTSMRIRISSTKPAN